jgi:hypothetical protein
MMLLQIEYQKKDSEITIFERCAIKGIYTKNGVEEGFKVYDEIRNGFRNISYSGIISIRASKI